MSNLSSMANSRLDTKLEHFLTHYFLAKGDNHEIWQMFKDNDSYDFEEFTSCNKQEFLEMRSKSNINVMKGFNDQKITLIHNVVLYHHFIRSSNNTKALAEDPIQ